MTLTVTTATRTTTRTFTRAPEYVIDAVESKAFTTLTTQCVVCGWAAYATCETGTATACAAHLATLHTCPEPGIILSVVS
jgi:hypothetical protein